MTIQFSCPHCGHHAKVDDQFAGHAGPCAGCEQQVTVPTIEQAMADGNHVRTEPDTAPVDPPAPKKSNGSGCCSGKMLVLGVIGFLVLVVLSMHAHEAAREAARRMCCTNYLKQLGLAMHNYHDTNKQFPPRYSVTDEGRGLSWRVPLIPFMASDTAYEQFRFDEPWDSEHNLTVAEEYSLAGYQCPSDRSREFKMEYKIVKGHKIALANYVMIAGPNTVGSAPEDGAVSFGNITDGTSNTIMFVEVTGDDRPAWTEPVDLDYDTFMHGINAGPGSASSNHPGGCNVALCDGSVHFLSDEISLEILKILATRNGGERVECDF